MIAVTIGSEILICRDETQADLIALAVKGVKAVVIYDRSIEGALVVGKTCEPSVEKINIRMYKEDV